MFALLRDTSMAPITVNRSTFHAMRTAAVQTDDKAKEPVTLNNCLITSCPQAHRQTSRGQLTSHDTVVLDETANQSPEYMQPSPDWNGLGEAMNSQAFRDKGYRQE